MFFFIFIQRNQKRIIDYFQLEPLLLPFIPFFFAKMDYSKSLYGAYIPSKGAAIFFVIAFCLFTILHVWKVLKTRQWFGIVTIVAGLCKFLCVVTLLQYPHT